MTTPPLSSGHHETLMFKAHPVRITMIDGVPFFALLDVCAAIGLSPEMTKRVHRPEFPAHALRVCSEQTEDGEQDALALSPVGVWWFTELTDPGRGQAVAAWARREAQRLCPNPRADDPTMFLTLTPERLLPPRPMRFSGWRTSWYDLRDTADYLTPAMIAARESRRRQTELPASLQAAHDAGAVA